MKRPFLVTDNGPSFIARRFTAFVKDQFSHVRIQYRTPQQLGLLERFHATLKTEEVYWRLYDHPQHAASAWPSSALVTTSVGLTGPCCQRKVVTCSVPAEVYRDGRNDPDSALAGLGPRGAGEVREDDGGCGVREDILSGFRSHRASDQGRRGPSPLDPSTLFPVHQLTSIK